MQLPISIPLSVISRYIEENYTGLLYAGVTTDWTGGDTHIEVRKIGEVALSAQQNRLLVAMPLEVVLDIRKNDPGIINVFKSIGGLKQLRFSIRVSFLFRPSWADGWTLHLVAEPDFDWIAKPRIASVLKVSIAAWIGPAIRQAIRRQAGEIADKIVEVIDLEKQVPTIWASIQQPILLNEDHQLWLELRPGQVLHRTEIQCTETDLMLRLQLPGKAHLTFSQPTGLAHASMPILITGFTLPDNEANALGWNATLPIAWLNAQTAGFQKRLSRLDQVEIQPRGERLLVEGMLQLGLNKVILRRKVFAEVSLQADQAQQQVSATIIQLELPTALRWLGGLLRRKSEVILNQLIQDRMMSLVQELESSLVNLPIGNDWNLSGSELKPTVSTVEIGSEMIHISGELYGKVGLRLDRL